MEAAVDVSRAVGVQEHGNGQEHETDDSEWEYEYDENEKETYYIAIDFNSAHVPPPQPPASMPNIGHRPRPAQNKSKDPLSPGSTPSDPSPSPSPDPIPAPEPTTTESIQILDLPTRNPLLYYRGAHYSAQWTRPIGSHLLFTKSAHPDADRDSPPSATATTDPPPLRSLPSHDLLAICTARLRASNAKLRRTLPPPSPPPIRSPTPPPPAAASDAEGGGSVAANGTGSAPPPPVKRIRLDPGAPVERVAQARFLERLEAVKAGRGERDTVKVTALRAGPPVDAALLRAVDAVRRGVGGNGEEEVEDEDEEGDYGETGEVEGEKAVAEGREEGDREATRGKRRRRWKRRVEAPLWAPVPPATLQDQSADGRDDAVENEEQEDEAMEEGQGDEDQGD